MGKTTSQPDAPDVGDSDGDGDGRQAPTRYTTELGNEICRRLCEGATWLSLAGRDGMPAYATLYDWRRKHPAFAEKLARAREIGADYRAEKALMAAEAASTGSAQADRLKVATLMKFAALGAPQRWGARAEAGETVRTQVLEVRVRRFERVVGPDGRAFVRELRPEGRSGRRRPGKAGEGA